MVPYSMPVLLALGLLTQPVAAGPGTAHQCGLTLATRARLTTQEAESVVQRIEMGSVDRSDLFLRMLYAVAYTESRFRADRRSSTGAIGLFQVTTRAAEHIHVIRTALGVVERRPTPAILAQVGSNVNYGSSYLALALEEAGGDWIGALVMYNSGYYGLTQLRRGGNVPLETSQYVVRVMHLASTCGL